MKGGDELGGKRKEGEGRKRKKKKDELSDGEPKGKENGRQDKQMDGLRSWNPRGGLPLTHTPSGSPSIINFSDFCQGEHRGAGRAEREDIIRLNYKKKIRPCSN